MQPRVFGHKAGMDALRTVAIAASDMRCSKAMTVCSPFQLKTGLVRPGDKFIMNLPVEFYDKYVSELRKRT